MMRKLALLLVAASFLLTACNTITGMVNGVGKDAAAAGVWVQEKVPADTANTTTPAK